MIDYKYITTVKSINIFKKQSKGFTDGLVRVSLNKK